MMPPAKRPPQPEAARFLTPPPRSLSPAPHRPRPRIHSSHPAAPKPPPTMKPKSTPTPASRTDLARHYRRIVAEQAPGTPTPGLDFDERAFLEIVAHYRQRGLTEESLEVVETGLAHFPFSAELYVAKAAVLTQLHVHEEGLEALALADTYASGLPAVHLQRARTLTALGRHDEAFAELDRLDDVDEPALRSQRAVVEATVFERMRRYSDMYFFVLQALREDVTNEEALDLLWIATELTSRHEETAALCERIISEDAYVSRAWYNLGHARSALGDISAALEAFEYAYLIDPRYEFAYREAGELCYETERYERAVDIYELMLEYVRGDNEVLLRLGQCYLHTGAHVPALLCINRVLKSVPEHDGALYYRGRCYADDGCHRQAVEAYRRAISLNPRDERYVASLAQSLVALGDYGAAEAAFAKTCDVGPEIAAHWLAHAAFLLERGRPFDTLDVIGEASEHVYAPELRYASVAAFIALGREAEGLRMLAKLLEEEYEYHESLFELAPALREHDLVAQVLRCFR